MSKQVRRSLCQVVTFFTCDKSFWGKTVGTKSQDCLTQYFPAINWRWKPSVVLLLWPQFHLGGIHKLRWQARGRGELSKCHGYYISLIAYVVNLSTKVKNPQKIFNVVYGCPIIEILWKSSVPLLLNKRVRLWVNIGRDISYVKWNLTKYSIFIFNM